ncbi:hypothetical protein [Pseudaestuariivita atlantica]|uniref:Uncharacterized protein n=1 Tax=Pseudaestuariivita atlantica TaxID=1317121 RepID=A0A0L1JKA9_9RHOB|nr:hypothetical protein [Pseudaestuariivita atlantica]KNG92194.1 hypothetical protein ATO11_18595 [Pseudaestuariivita atlantica]
MGLIHGTNPIASWWFAIIIVAVVTVVVAVLLIQIIRTAAAIDEEVATVWANGQRVANNTIHIAVLYRTHEYVQGILGRAGRILGSAEAIRDHAQDCPSCPKCIWHRG